jgi:hypothetical protein
VGRLGRFAVNRTTKKSANYRRFGPVGPVGPVFKRRTTGGRSSPRLLGQQCITGHLFMLYYKL